VRHGNTWTVPASRLRFLAASPEKSAGALAVVAGLIAAVKLARVEAREIQLRSPRVRSIIAESVTIARMVIEASRAGQ
jgi:hypothetical protein